MRRRLVRRPHAPEQPLGLEMARQQDPTEARLPRVTMHAAGPAQMPEAHHRCPGTNALQALGHALSGLQLRRVQLLRQGLPSSPSG